jgi:ribulose-phosphate 3-epimerase
MQPVKIAASILAADFTRLGEQVQEALDAKVEYIHVDVMDGHFVPNLTIGAPVVAALRPLVEKGGVPLDVHLMVERPENLIQAFAEAGTGVLTVHVETCPHLHQTVQTIKALGMRAGVTLNPATPLMLLEDILPEVSRLLVMSVNPGFGGQSYIPAATDRIARLRRWLELRNLEKIEIAVDGGIKPQNTPEVVAAGADVLVVGSGLFNHKASVKDNVAAYRRAILRTFG